MSSDNIEPLLDLLTEAEAAILLHRTPRTLASWRANGYGPPYLKCGRTPMYRRASAEKWLAAQERRA